MNNQPKFKKGDKVVYCGDKGKVIDTLTQEESPDLKEPFIRVSFEDCCIWVPESLCQIQNYSPTPDILAIPDDHVWSVEWRKLEDGEYGVLYSNGNSITGIKSHATHYLTEADLLKLPFKK